MGEPWPRRNRACNSYGPDGPGECRRCLAAARQLQCQSYRPAVVADWRPASQTMTVSQFWVAVATMGGYLGRRGTGHPGGRRYGRAGAASLTLPKGPAPSSLRPLPHRTDVLRKDQGFSPERPPAQDTRHPQRPPAPAQHPSQPAKAGFAWRSSVASARSAPSCACHATPQRPPAHDTQHRSVPLRAGHALPAGTLDGRSCLDPDVRPRRAAARSRGSRRTVAPIQAMPSP